MDRPDLLHYICNAKSSSVNAGIERHRPTNLCLQGNGKLFELHAVVVMPDHVHLMLTPLADENGEISLSEIMQTIKSASAHRINRYLGFKGRIWQQESFDRAMREVENARGRIEYMVGNPVRAGLASNPYDYRWVWTSTGGDARAST